MATTKLIAIKATEAKALAYIANPEKTDNGRLIFTYGCSQNPLQASRDFAEIRKSGTGLNTLSIYQDQLGHIPKVENLEKKINALMQERSEKNMQFHEFDKKARDLADAQRKIGKFPCQEQNRKRKNNGNLEQFTCYNLTVKLATS